MTDNNVYYDSYKEDRDIILEYNQINLKEATVSNLLGMGIDNLTCMQAVAKTVKMAEEGGVHHIIPLNPYSFLRYRSNRELKTIYNKSSMKFAAEAGIQWSARMVKFPIRERIPFVHYMMELIRISEIKEISIFIVGGKPETAERAFANIRKSFPNIRIVGRHGGFFSPEREKSVVEAIRKSEANIIFVGMGFPKEDRWITKFSKEFKNAVFISAGGAIDIISGENRKAPEYFTERGLVWFYRILTKPWRAGRMLRIILFFIHTIFYRLFKSR